MPCVTFEIKREPRSIFVKKLRNTSHMSASLQLLLVYSLSHVLEPHRGWVELKKKKRTWQCLVILLGGSERFFHRYFLWSWWDFKRQRVAPSLARRWAECVTKHNWARNIKRDRLNIEVNDRWWWGEKRMRTRVLIRFTRPWEIPKLFFFCWSEFSPFSFLLFFSIL
jgi:hypothetical protein